MGPEAEQRTVAGPSRSAMDATPRLDDKVSQPAGPPPGPGADQRGELDFFISYTAADRPWAEWIAWQLEDEGYRTAVQAWDSRPGDDFVSWMDRAIRSAKHVLVVLSPAYEQATSFTTPEWTAAVGRDPTGEHAVLLPVRVADFTPGGLLRTRAWVDLVGKDESGARAALLEGAHQRRRKPATMPVFPSHAGPISTPAGRAEQAPSAAPQPHFPGPDPMDCLRDPMRQLAQMSARFGTRMPINTARRMSLRMTFVPTVRSCLDELERVNPDNWPDIGWAVDFNATRSRAVDKLGVLVANLDREPSQEIMDLLHVLEQLRERVAEKYPQVLVG
jgi:hypothetical protein